MKLPEEKRKFIELIEKGSSVTKACQLLNIHRSTFYDWRNNNASFAKEYLQARTICHDETSDAAGYHYQRLVREGDKRFVLKWLDEQHPEFVQKPLRVLLHKVGDFESGLVSLEKDELFQLILSYQNSGFEALDTLDEKLRSEYQLWLAKHHPHLTPTDPVADARNEIIGNIMRHTLEKRAKESEGGVEASDHPEADVF